MGRLDELTGQRMAIDAVLARQTTRKKDIVAIIGPAGSGVTWTLGQIANAWETTGGAALQATGEAFAKERSFFPWLTLASPGAKHLARFEVLRNSFSRGSRGIPIVGHITSYLIEELLNYRKNRLARESVVLTAQEQDILYIVQTVTQQKRLLLTIDHLEAWDSASWDLLQLMLSPSLEELYPALADTLVLIGASEGVTTRLHALDKVVPITELKLRLLDRQDVVAAYSAFGIPVERQQEVDLLYETTNGRLDLLRDLGTHLQQTGISNTSITGNAFYDSIMERRLQGLGGEPLKLEDLLAAAAFLGQTFVIDDIRCLTGQSQEDLCSCFRIASSEHLLSSVGEMLRFHSAALHQYFHRAKANEHIKYHGKFAECLRTMRPADYEHRLTHLMLAGRDEDAFVCYALAVLNARRLHRLAPDPGSLRTIPGWNPIQVYLDTMDKAYRAYDERRLGNALQAIDEVEPFLPDVLIAERDYLEAQTLLKSHQVSDYQRATRLLESWQCLKDREGEVWSRIAQLLMVALVQTDRVEDARKVEAELTTNYWNRRKVDPSALYCLNVLRRKSECLHQCATTVLRLESALAYFGPNEYGALPRHPIQYYYTLTNLIGNLAAGGRYNEAYDRAVEVDELVHNHPQVPWPALEIASNNLVIAGYLARKIEATRAVGLMEQVLCGSMDRGDRILMENNYAVFLLHARQQSKAHDVLRRAYAEIMKDGRPDEYHSYFIGNNLAALSALAGDITSAHQIRHKITPGLSRLYPAIRETLQRRDQLLEPAFVEAAQIGPEMFDRYLTDRHAQQLGPQWAFYGRGFLLSDIQFWSAD